MKKKYSFKRNFRPRVILVATVIIIFLLFLLYRVIYISVVLGKEYEYSAVTQHTSRVLDSVITPKRGEILDTNGEKLATSVTIYDVIFDIAVFMSDDSHLDADKREEYLIKVSEITEVPYEELNTYIENDMVYGNDGSIEYNTHYKRIKRDLSYEKGKEFEAANLTPFFYLEAKSQRVYMYDNIASHILGFIRGDTVDSYWGIEKMYNEYLLGEYGRYYRTYDENGNLTTNNISEVDGDTITLTIDTTIQTTLEELSEKYGELYNADNVSAVVMNPNTGAILGMANYANFNSNSPSSIEDINSTRFKKEYEDLETIEEKSLKIMNAWRNFAITDSYEPGSVFKPIVFAAALEEEVVNANTKFYCPGYKIVGDQKITCWNTNGHGEQNLEQAIANSCNPAAIEINQMLGKEKFYQYQKDFGYGELTGIDLPAEVSLANSNLIPTLEQLNITELSTSGMGQGFSATVIQNTVAFASLINGGKLLQPYVVSHITGEDGTTKLVNSTKIIKKTISEDVSNYMRVMLQSVVSPEGTGKGVIIEGYNIGGKTGTAQQKDRDLDLNALSFIGYFPVEDPQYIINVVIYIPRPYIRGTTTAVPFSKELIESIIAYKNIPPSNTYNIDNKDYLNKNKIIVPDYVGQNIVGVTKQLNNYGYSFEISGKGENIVNQIPAPNTEMSNDATIFLYVEDTLNEEAVNSENSEVKEENVEKNVSVATTKLQSSQYNAIPNLVGLSENEAIRILETMNFTYRVIVKNTGSTEEVADEENSDNLIESNDKKHTVTGQMPSEGAVLPEGTQVRLIVE